MSERRVQDLQDEIACLRAHLKRTSKIEVDLKSKISLLEAEAREAYERGHREGFDAGVDEGRSLA